MAAALGPEDEEERLRTLYEYEILDTGAEQEFDDLAQVAAQICGTSVSMINLVDRTRQWAKAMVNIDLLEIDREWSFCAHAITGGDIMVVPDTRADPRFEDNVLVTSAQQPIRFYAGAPIRAYNTQPLGALCVIDSTPRSLDASERSALDALARVAERLLEQRRLRRRLEHAQESKDLLMRFVTHDLNNRLVTVLGNADLLADMTEDHHQLHELAGQLLDGAEEIRNMVASLGELQRAESGDLVVRPQPVDVVALLRDLEVAFRARATQCGVDIAVASTGRAPGAVLADPDLLRRMIENLLANALAHAPRDTVVSMGAERDEGAVGIYVADEGPGVPAAECERIFEPFVQLDGATVDRSSSGLGLAFCRKAAEAQGGEIWADPNGNRGAVFHIRLPSAPGSAARLDAP